MQECTLPYIPQRLHTNNKLKIAKFEVGEFLYRRCKPEELENPFKNITITELSHNRGGFRNNLFCNPDDVLFSIKKDEAFEEYEGNVVCYLEIKSLNDKNKYRKEYTQTKNNDEYNCVMELLHEPEPCMFPHCVFRVWINNEIVTRDNCKETINKLKTIRTSLKEELASMIYNRQISQNDNPLK